MPSNWKCGMYPVKSVLADVDPIKRRPESSTRSASAPAVSSEIVSFAGNLIAVFVSPV